MEESMDEVWRREGEWVKVWRRCEGVEEWVKEWSREECGGSWRESLESGSAWE